MSRDLQRFFAMHWQPRSPISPVTQILLVQNWTDELKPRVRAASAR
jgi:hypothetical protein